MTGIAATTSHHLMTQVRDILSAARDCGAHDTVHDQHLTFGPDEQRVIIKLQVTLRIKKI